MRGLALLVAVPLLLLMSACVIGTHREGNVIAAASVAQLRVGHTTKQEVLDLFGPPTSFQRVRDSGLDAAVGGREAKDEDGDDVYIYEYVEERERFFSLVILYTYFRRDRLSDRLMVTFDDDDRVRYVAFTSQTGKAGGPEGS